MRLFCTNCKYGKIQFTTRNSIQFSPRSTISTSKTDKGGCLKTIFNENPVGIHINTSTNQSINQSINRSIHQPKDQSIKQKINKPINKSIDPWLSINCIYPWLSLTVFIVLADVSPTASRGSPVRYILK